jgi:hypothetical protein
MEKQNTGHQQDTDEGNQEKDSKFLIPSFMWNLKTENQSLVTNSKREAARVRVVERLDGCDAKNGWEESTWHLDLGNTLTCTYLCQNWLLYPPKGTLIFPHLFHNKSQKKH